jgi:hypothetical protein
MVHVDKMESGHSPYGPKGDILWVREAWQVLGIRELDPATGEHRVSVRYRADNGHESFLLNKDTEALEQARRFAKKTGWSPNIFCPRWACRLFLLVKDVRVERVQDITIEDAKAEGVEVDLRDRVANHYRGAFQKNWNDTYDEDGLRWRDNPWVWVVEFERFHHQEESA